jgi:hypothetical protein
VACERVLDACIFCGGDDMTEEHLVADWVLRAFAKSRKPAGGFRGTYRDWGSGLKVTADEPIDTAKVVCRPCNNEWLSRIDTAASEVLKPLIRGHGGSVQLDRDGQEAVAAWLFKTALIFDASQEGADGPLAPLRAAFMRDRVAPSGCAMFAGPAPSNPLTIDGIPEVAGFSLFGVRQIAGELNLTGEIKSADGAESATVGPRKFPIPGYLVMVGRLEAMISGARFPLAPGPERCLVRIWPHPLDEAVTLTTVDPGRPGA